MNKNSNHYDTKAMAAIIAEADRQDELWGPQRNKHNFVWQTILTEEVGEAAEAALHNEFGGKYQDIGHLREEVVQIAAVCMQWIEDIDQRLERGMHDDSKADPA